MFYPGIKFGTATMANGYTSNFGLSKLKGVVLTTISDNDAIVGCAITTTGTVSAYDDSGSAISTAFDVSYIAWGDL